MKLLATLILLTLGSNVKAVEIFDCDFLGPNYILTLHDDNHVTLENSFRKFICQKGTVKYPGTDLDLNVINCESTNKKTTYYLYRANEEEILLTKEFILTKDIFCKKI
jgi:hypothetical protein